MNANTFRNALLGMLCAASIAIPPANAADVAAPSKRMKQAIAKVRHMHANQLGLAAQQAKIAVDGIKRRVTRVKANLKNAPSKGGRNDLLATLEQLNQQEDQLVHSYKQLSKTSDAEWGTAKKNFLNDYDRLQQSLSDAEEGH